MDLRRAAAETMLDIGDIRESSSSSHRGSIGGMGIIMGQMNRTYPESNLPLARDQIR
jgi:hypothetical protein